MFSQSLFDFRLMDELVIEIQERFDQLEMMVEGILKENDVCAEYLDEETVLQTIDSLIYQSELLETQQEIRSQKDIPDVDAKIKKCTKEFEELRKKKKELYSKLTKMEKLDVSMIMQYICENKQKIYKEVLIKTSDVIHKSNTITKAEIDKIYNLSLVFCIKKTIKDYIESF